MLPKNGGGWIGLLGLIVGLAAFDVIYGVAIYRTITTETSISWNAPTLYIGSLAFGLVGGVVASGAGVDWKPPASPTPPGGAGASPDMPAPSSENEDNRMTVPLGIGAVNIGTSELSKVLTHETLLRWIGRLWIASFFIIAVGALVAWVIRADVASDFISTLAVSSFGLILAAARAYAAKSS